MNATLHTTDGRSVLRFERRLAHPVEKVWRAVTDPAEMAHWFPAIVEMDPRPGGRIRYTYPAGEAAPDEGRIIELDPPRVFALTWNGDALRMELTPDGTGTRLVFTHTFTDRPMAGSFATGWETCLGALDKTLAGPVEGSLIAPERYAERHDAYVARFGLGEGTLRAGDDTIRFERLLPHPVEQVWPALTRTENGEPAVGGPPPLPATNAYVPAGDLTAVRDEQLLEYTWLRDGAPAGRVRWELTGGHPAGTRVVLTQTGPADEPATALAAWHTHLEVLADHLRGVTHCPWPKERTEELAARYAGRAEAR
ncbi:SRPBCC family protein [Actinoallomurus sp. CA-142502]|uniref:SRPBCC family protein n=1 Tax=Actinoallomurus sp. CA-142502 TaxID=3239885 RepID=UPI003D8D237E